MFSAAKKSLPANAWLVVYAGLLAGGLFIAFSHRAYDDPFITYRYAENLTYGAGFVYNPGERVLSTTTPLFTIWLAVFSLLWSDMHGLAVLTGCLSLAAGGVILYKLGQESQMPWVGWAGLGLYPFLPLLVSTLGSETPFYVALCLGAFLYFSREKYTLSAALSALAVLTRPDGALVVGLLGTVYLLKIRRPIPWKAVFLLLGITLPWFVFAWVYFGSAAPVTLGVKRAQLLIPYSESFFAGTWTIGRTFFSPSSLLAGGVALVGLFSPFSRRGSLVLLLAWTGLYYLSYSLLGISRYFWYYAPLLPGLVVLVGAGMSQLERSLIGLRKRITGSGETPRLGWQHWVLVCAFLAMALMQWKDLARMSQNPDPRYVAYRLAGEWLRSFTPQDATVATLEVGIIGYYAERRMVDFAGLIRPEVAMQATNQTTYEDLAFWTVDRYQPEYLVIREGSLNTLEQDYASVRCTQEERVIHEPVTLLIYACK